MLGHSSLPVTETSWESWSEPTGPSAPDQTESVWSSPSLWPLCWRLTSAESGLHKDGTKWDNRFQYISNVNYYVLGLRLFSISDSYNRPWGCTHACCQPTFLRNGAEVLLKFNVVTRTLHTICQQCDGRLIVHQLSTQVWVGWMEADRRHAGRLRDLDRAGQHTGPLSITWEAQRCLRCVWLTSRTNCEAREPCGTLVWIKKVWLAQHHSVSDLTWQPGHQTSTQRHLDFLIGLPVYFKMSRL